jgi:hypothetical protein
MTPPRTPAVSLAGLGGRGVQERVAVVTAGVPGAAPTRSNSTAQRCCPALPPRLLTPAPTVACSQCNSAGTASCTASGDCTCKRGWAGARCDACAPNFKPPGSCSSCTPGFAGDDCNTCALGRTGTNCDQCARGYAGAACTECKAGYTKSFTGACYCAANRFINTAEACIACGAGATSPANSRNCSEWAWLGAAAQRAELPLSGSGPAPLLLASSLLSAASKCSNDPPQRPPRSSTGCSSPAVFNSGSNTCGEQPGSGGEMGWVGSWLELPDTCDSWR